MWVVLSGDIFFPISGLPRPPPASPLPDPGEGPGGVPEDQLCWWPQPGHEPPAFQVPPVKVGDPHSAPSRALGEGAGLMTMATALAQGQGPSVRGRRSILSLKAPDTPREACPHPTSLRWGIGGCARACGFPGAAAGPALRPGPIARPSPAVAGRCPPKMAGNILGKTRCGSKARRGGHTEPRGGELRLIGCLSREASL